MQQQPKQSKIPTELCKLSRVKDMYYINRRILTYIYEQVTIV
jgi:hypothetical protein